MFTFEVIYYGDRVNVMVTNTKLWLYKLKYVVIYIIFFYYVFPFELVLFSQGLQRACYYLVPCLYFTYHYSQLIMIWRHIREKNWLCACLLLYIVIFLWSCFVMQLNNSDDTMYLTVIRSVIQHSYVFLFLSLLIYNNLSSCLLIQTFCRMYVISCMVHVSTTIVMIADLSLFNYWHDMIWLETDNKIINSPNRFSISGYSGFTTTLRFSVAMSLSLYLCSVKDRVGWLAIPFILAGNLCYGRIGVVVSLFLLVIYVGKNFSWRTYKLLMRLIFLMGTILFIAVNVVDDNVLMVMSNWLMEPITKFTQSLNYGKVSFGESGDTLINNMYFWPKNDMTLLIGDGRYAGINGGYYMNTDAGFMRRMLFFGVIGSSLSYIMLFVYMYVAYKQSRSSRINQVNILYTMIPLIMLLFEFKGDAYSIFFGYYTAFIILSTLETKQHITELPYLR